MQQFNLKMWFKQKEQNELNFLKKIIFDLSWVEFALDLEYETICIK